MSASENADYRTPIEGACSIEGCGQDLYARGWCSKHYTRWWRHGHPLTYTYMTAEEAEAIRQDPRRQADIAADYGITQVTVSHIKTGKRHRRDASDNDGTETV